MPKENRAEKTRNTEGRIVKCYPTRDQGPLFCEAPFVAHGVVILDRARKKLQLLVA
jgi:hypothetical protein